MAAPSACRRRGPKSVAGRRAAAQGAHDLEIIHPRAEPPRRSTGRPPPRRHRAAPEGAAGRRAKTPFSVWTVIDPTERDTVDLPLTV